MRVLVTGGAGFIGSHVVDRLVNEGHDVVVLDNFEPQVHAGTPKHLNPSATYVRGDMRDESCISKCLEGVEVIFHLAAMVGVGQSMYEIRRYVETNTAGTAKLLECLIREEHDVKKLIVASSMSVYGEGAYECESCGVIYPKTRSEEQLRRKEWEMRCPNCGKIVKPIPTDEDKPLHPTSVYAMTKRDQEELCLNVGMAYGIPTVALRYFNVYGPRQSLSNPYTGVCAIFSSRIKNNNPPVIFEDGLQSRDFVSVHDIVQASILAMQRKAADYEVFNVGTGRATTVLDVAHTLLKLYGRKLEPKITNEYRAGDIRHCFADISKIRDKLGFKPTVNFEDGMRELVAWGSREEAIDRFEKAHQELKSRGLSK